MTDSNFQIIAVDNDSRELDKIRKAFDLLKTPCLPILYNEGDNIDEKYSNIRIAFFDINLGGLGNPADPLLCNIIASALKEILDKNYGSRSKKGEFLRFELSHNALNRKPQK